MFFTKRLPGTEIPSYKQFEVSTARLVALLLICSSVFWTCTNKPTIEECRTSLANFLRIQLGDSATPAEINRMVTEEPISVRMTKRCVETKTKKQVQCEMSAPNQAELRKCARFAKKSP